MTTRNSRARPWRVGDINTPVPVSDSRKVRHALPRPKKRPMLTPRARAHRHFISLCLESLPIVRSINNLLYMYPLEVLQ